MRRRPGMYIGGTDERALHHLAAEVLDNSMDEAVAGHASRIEVTLAAEAGTAGRLTVADNGRGMPVDEHPKYPGKSALEVIMTMLHSGGKFSRQGLCDLGRAARRRRLRGQRAVDRHRSSRSPATSRSIARPLRAACRPPRWRRSARPRTGAAPPSPSPPMRRFSGDDARFKPARLYRLARSKAYLFAGVEIRWKCDPRCSVRRQRPAEAVFQFPGGLADHLREQMGTRNRDLDAVHRQA